MNTTAADNDDLGSCNGDNCESLGDNDTIMPESDGSTDNGMADDNWSQSLLDSSLEKMMMSMIGLQQPLSKLMLPKRKKPCGLSDYGHDGDAYLLRL